MTSETEIANFSISRAGVSTRIADLDERSEAAKVCKLWYAQCRDATLRAFPWSFATKIKQLAHLSGMDDYGYEAVYALPTDCLMPKSLTNASAYGSLQQGVGGLRWYWEECNQSDWIRNYTAQFDLLQHENGNTQVLATNWTDAYLVYIAKSPITGLYPPDFVDALSWKLASEIVLPLQGKADFAVNAKRMFSDSIREAWANALNERGRRPAPDSRSITIRG